MRLYSSINYELFIMAYYQKKSPLKQTTTYKKDGNNYEALVTVDTKDGKRTYSSKSPDMAFAKEKAYAKSISHPADSVITKKVKIK